MKLLFALVVSALLCDARDSRVAIIVPLHPPKFPDALGLLNSSLHFSLPKTDFVFVLSTALERSEFSSAVKALYQGDQTGGYARVRLLVVPCQTSSWDEQCVEATEADGHTLTHSHSPAFYKKFYAVQHYAHDYGETPRPRQGTTGARQVVDSQPARPAEYYLIVDADLLVVGSADLYAICSSLFRRRILWGFKVPSGHRPTLMQSSLLRFTPEEREAICQDGTACSVWLWWNELPIMSASTALEFINGRVFADAHCSLRPLPNTTAVTDANEYDYVAYTYWLILKHDFVVLDLNALSASTKMPVTWTSLSSPLLNLTQRVLRVMDSHWAPLRALQAHPEAYAASSLVFAFHVDRLT